MAEVKGMAQAPVAESGSNGFFDKVADVADFLFATKSLGRLFTGQGSWGDLGAVGLTAASFFIPPFKLLKFTPEALRAVTTAADEVVGSAASQAAKNAAIRTAENAKYLIDNPDVHRKLLYEAETKADNNLNKLSSLSSEANHYIENGDVPYEILGPKAYPDNVSAAVGEKPSTPMPRRAEEVGLEEYVDPSTGEIAKRRGISDAVQEEGVYEPNQYKNLSDEEYQDLVNRGKSDEYISSVDSAKAETNKLESLPEGSLIIDERTSATGLPKLDKNEILDIIQSDKNIREFINKGRYTSQQLSDFYLKHGKFPEEVAKEIFDDVSRTDIKKLFKALDREMPVEDEFGRTFKGSALQPEIDQLKDEFETLSQFRAFYTTDKQQTSQLISVFEDLVKTEPRKATRERMGALINDLKVNDIKSEFWKKLNVTIDSKKNRINSLEEMLKDRTSKAAKRQSTHYITSYKGDKYDPAAPTSFKPTGGSKRGVAPEQSAKSTMSELKADEKNIMDQLEIEKDPVVRKKLRNYLQETRDEIFWNEVRSGREYLSKQSMKDLSSPSTQVLANRIDKKTFKKIESTIWYTDQLIEAIDNGMSGITTKEINRQLGMLRKMRNVVPKGRKELLKKIDDAGITLKNYRDAGKHLNKPVDNVEEVVKPLTAEERNAATLAKVNDLPKTNPKPLTDEQINKLKEAEKVWDTSKISDLPKLSSKEPGIKLSNLSEDELNLLVEAERDAMLTNDWSEYENLVKLLQSKSTNNIGDVVRWNGLSNTKKQNVVYIGRASGDRGKFGNPFPVGNGVSVKESVNKYRKWLWEKIKSNPDYAKELYALKGKRLACPGSEPNDACHGQVILKAIEYLEKHPELMEGK